MGLFDGSVTFLYFKAIESIPEDFREKWLSKLQFYGFKGIDPTSDLDIAFGWVNPMNILDSDLSWEKLIWGEYLLLGLRIDTLRIPPLLLKAHVREAERRYMEKKEKETLTRYERVEVKTMVLKELRTKTLPAPRVIEVAWNMPENKIYLGTTAKKAVGLFMDLFEKTFSIRLMETNPYSMAMAGGLDEVALSQFTKLMPSNFTG